MSGHPLIAVGFLAFFVVALVVGVRLLLLWWRTRQLPELLIGIGVLGIGPVGFGLQVAATELGAASADHQGWLLGTGILAVSVGVACKFVFNWRVYHPDNRWIPPLVHTAAVLLGITFVADLLAGFSRDSLPWTFYVRSPIQVGALLWGAGEALAYWSRMRRRVRLDLGDPVVCNRFLLWGIGAGAAGIGSLIGVTAQMVVGATHAQIPWVLASSSAHGMAAAVAMWLAFVPPAAYLRWVAARPRG